jgi:hypothetical protein
MISLRSLLTFWFCYGSNLAFAAGVIDWDLMHTRPECKTSPDGPVRTFCMDTDRKEIAKLSGMEDQVAAMIARAKDSTAKIYIAYFSFSNSAAFNALCEAGKRGVQIEGYFDTDYEADQSNKPNQLRSQCQQDLTGAKNVKVFFLGEKAKNPDGSLLVWRLHHNKFLIVDPGASEEGVNLNFSSGNLSASGLSIHFDHWVKLLVSKDSNILKIHHCVIEGLRAAITNSDGETLPTDNPKIYQATKNSCLQGVDTDVESGLAKEGIAPLFAPNESNDIYYALKTTIEKVANNGQIYGAIQHFLHQGIKNDLAKAVKRGVKVRLIMDDDVILGSSEVPGVGDFFQQQLKPTKISFQFMQTNSSVMQMMHNKFLIFEKVKVNGGTQDRVFSGAGHFTTSAMKNNYENFYLTQNVKLTGLYKTLFTYMWQRSVTEEVATGHP